MGNLSSTKIKSSKSFNNGYGAQGLITNDPQKNHKNLGFQSSAKIASLKNLHAYGKIFVYYQMHSDKTTHEQAS